MITVYYSLLNIIFRLAIAKVFLHGWVGQSTFFRSFSDLGKFNRDVENHSDMFYFFRYADRLQQ